MEGKGVGEESRDGITRGPVGDRGPVRGLCLTGWCLGPVNRMFVGGKLKELHRKTDSGRPRDPNFPVLASEQGERHSPWSGQNTSGLHSVECGGNTVFHWILEKKIFGDIQRQLLLEEHQHFYSGKSHSIRREVLCSRFESSTDRFRNKCENSHPEIIS